METRVKALQWAVVALLGIITGGVGVGFTGEDARCAVDAEWRGRVNAHIDVADTQLTAMAGDVAVIREMLAELRGRGAFSGSER